MGLAYALLYASVALSLSRTVELDWLALPALALAAVTALAERTSLSERRIAVLGMAGLTVIAAVAAAVAS
ncbi:hypothetical protein [Streptomyces sp. BPTC-684]|uniref:hypothetical protein n=1 Tax=Streptomyces sp. BPTC-684 TaxID=3043734 RepID=UPI0024B1CE67|nr:hypothetical protein [Streptomyces sp. BPTC-684]WHM38259.1 hypothetical protein QIY60_15925 [Streptomyces sp. BPTC-684]